jgi:cell division protein FtsA
MPEEMKQQDTDMIFALDIGTRSIIGVVGRTEGERLHVLAIEKEEHGKRAMVDGQIEDIKEVGRVARCVTDRLEQRLGFKLRRVCVAAAGRTLRTEKGYYALNLPQVTQVDSELVGQLESGAVSDAESHLLEGQEDGHRFYLVGYTVTGFQLDHYPMNILKGHSGKLLEVNVVATFLPSQVVESLYAVMEAAGLEVASLTLEPIAALNAAIPADLRLLNLVLVDIGAGTSDIAACRDGAVVGYTMATTAGDEITEAIMRAYLVDFATAERMKTGLHAPAIPYRDVLGLEQSVSGAQVREAIAGASQALTDEIARHVVSINGGPPSAVFLAGGGSKLEGLRELVAKTLGMDERRVALAGSNYDKSAFSQEYDLNDPEYATPLGIAVSAGLGLISDSYRILLNGHPAKLFRSGTLTLLELLMMNGYTSNDLVGRTGRNLSITVDGRHMIFRGQPATPCVLTLNGKAAAVSTLVYAGDAILFTPAVPGASARRTLRGILGEDFLDSVKVNGKPAALDMTLSSGDHVATQPAPPKTESAPDPEEQAPSLGRESPVTPEQEREEVSAFPPMAERRTLEVRLNGHTLLLPGKDEGIPYYLMDLLEYSQIDFKHLNREVELLVNGVDGSFTQELNSGDEIVIHYKELR